MNLPSFTPSGVLPPFVGDPTFNARSPYSVGMSDVVHRFGTTARRREILRGLIEYRGELRRIGVAMAFQWLDGSFAENLAREPNDIDLVTFAEQIPPFASLGRDEKALFQPAEAKRRFLCDAYLVQLSTASKAKLVERVSYWLGLFSHRRVTLEWKGILQVSLDDARQDDDAIDTLDLLDAQGIMES